VNGTIMVTSKIGIAVPRVVLWYRPPMEQRTLATTFHEEEKNVCFAHGYKIYQNWN